MSIIDLENEGVIEYISAEEQENCYIAYNINEFNNTYGLNESDCITIAMVIARAFDFTKNMDKFKNKFC